jgi:hypothetical protein
MASVGTGIDFGHAVNSKTAFPAYLTPAIEPSCSGHYTPNFILNCSSIPGVIYAG